MYNKLNRKRVKNVKNRIKEEREIQGISQEELSKKSTISRTIISGLETGKIDTVTNITLEKIADALNKKITEIFFQE